ncbi:bacteriophage minor tail subunit [Mycobacteroides chelonae]|uniref:phage tail protein n=1 Tax=Mycobacteroides chelonae TaxID=1774 RepID=UPI0021DE3238|nr:phage tail protein [Mycobacteroides chelonae]GLE59528.1 bacteriophage minor tail subunit [Mycobacteroides chelonae]
MTTPPITPQVGDRVFLKTITANLNIFGIISDLDTPDQVSATLELFGTNGVMSLAALMGPPGPAGSNAPTPKLQHEVYTSPSQLPNTLTDDEIDIGKYWIIEDRDEVGNVTGSKAYIWHGDHWQAFMMGSEGPPGPVPIITPNVVLLDPEGTTNSYITVTGTDAHPTWTLYLKAPRGPQGPSTAIGSAPDYDGSVPPEFGDGLVYNGEKWAPTKRNALLPQAFTMPESMFIDGQSFGTTLPIGSIQLPPQDFDWVPWVTGHVRATGVTLSINPLAVGCEVRLKDVNNGQIVARGHGNISTWANISPHFSTSARPGDAIAPGNGVGVVPANHTGNDGTLFVRLFNDGAFGDFTYDNAGSQLSILVMPVG